MVCSLLNFVHKRFHLVLIPCIHVLEILIIFGIESKAFCLTVYSMTQEAVIPVVCDYRNSLNFVILQTF